jgi:pimeloyl-ACP methyl ester carboxylesterase
MAADRERRADTAAFRLLGERQARGEFANNEAQLCREQARLFTPVTFADTSLARLVPDVCDNPTEWPTRLGAFFGVFLESIEGFDWRDSLSTVTAPRLVIHGERDNTPLAGNEEWVTGQARARLLVVPGAGHWPHYERPTVTLAAIGRFLSGDWPDGAISIPRAR